MIYSLVSGTAFYYLVQRSSTEQVPVVYRPISCDSEGSKTQLW